MLIFSGHRLKRDKLLNIKYNQNPPTSCAASEGNVHTDRLNSKGKHAFSHLELKLCKSVAIPTLTSLVITTLPHIHNAYTKKKKESCSIPQKTHCVFVAKIILLMLLTGRGEEIAVRSDKKKKRKNTPRRKNESFLNVKTGDTNSYRCSLKS